MFLFCSYSWGERETRRFRRSTELLARVFTLLAAADVDVEMLSQGASKVNISIVVHDDDAERVVNLLHSCFFEEKCELGL